MPKRLLLNFKKNLYFKHILELIIVINIKIDV